ncbi:MAG: sensor N-terminal transmembrane domain-containing protein, partial [Kiloniellales bacterium]
MSAESRSERPPRLRSAEPWDDEDESSDGKARHRAEEAVREPRERARKSEDESVARPRRPAWLSPLTLRILAINVLVLAIPVLGLLHLGQYRQSLIAAELDALILQGRTFTLPLANSAVAVSVSGEESLEAEPTRQLMRVLLT